MSEAKTVSGGEAAIAFAKVVGATVWMVVGSLLNAFTFWALWGWFLVPIGAPPITYAHAYGIGLLATWLGMIASLVPKEREKIGVTIVAKTITNGLLLAAGAIVHAAMQ